MAAHHIYHGLERKVPATDAMQGAYLGPSFNRKEIGKVIMKYKAQADEVHDFGKLGTKTEKLIADGNVVGWFQGRMEFGPRALGNRSILADARNPEIQKILNL